MLTKIKSCVMVYCVSKNLGTTLEISVLLCAFTCYPFILGGAELTHLTCHIYQGNTDQEHSPASVMTTYLGHMGDLFRGLYFVCIAKITQ